MPLFRIPHSEAVLTVLQSGRFFFCRNAAGAQTKRNGRFRNQIVVYGSIEDTAQNLDRLVIETFALAAQIAKNQLNL